MNLLLLIGLAVSRVFAVPAPAEVQDVAAPAPHRVCSFNIRYGSAKDGPDRWELRRTRVVETLVGLDADVVGLQEAESFQVRELLEALPRYGAVGVHRDDGRLAGEGATVLYDRTRYTLAAAGTFWLSDTPDLPGSNTWGAACNRTCTWVRLVDLGTGAGFYVFNTHFDHKAQIARERSARLLVERIEGRGSTDPFLVIGDLNAGERNPALEMLKRGGAGWTLVDTFRVVHPADRAGTFTGFDPASDGGATKIDHVLMGPGLEVVGAEVDRRQVDGRYPSDHFPVWADLVIGGR